MTSKKTQTNSLATKPEILDFVSRVQAKAVHSVIQKYQKLEEIAITNYLSQPENSALSALLSKQQALVDELRGVEKKLAEIFSAQSVRYFYGSELRDMKSIFFGAHGYPKNAGQLEELAAQRNSEIQNIKAEYYKITQNLGLSMTNAARIVYLETLGFDCSTLKNRHTAIVSAVDTSTLFPCGDNK